MSTALGFLVLVVDDDADIRDAVTDLLSDAGYEVQCAPNGQEALAQLRSEPRLPDAILLDLMMPMMDGSAFRWEQLTYPELANIPVLILSATVDCKKSATTLRTAGCIQKPFTPENLLEELTRICSI